MTALGILYPGHYAEDDYPRIEQLLAGDIRVDLVHTDVGEDAHREEALREIGSPQRLRSSAEQLRLAGAEAVVWACTSGSFLQGWEGAHEQVRTIAVTAGMPASSTAFAFVNAAREVGARRVAVAATYPQDVADLFAGFLRAAGTEVVSVHGAGAGAGAGGRMGRGRGAGARACGRPRRRGRRPDP
jgi:maleate cis-trans isomerase